ncbi:MAG: hypothetical protein ACETWE_07515 [Candidatus Bathyarchaeia archaeon]
MGNTWKSTSELPSLSRRMSSTPGLERSGMVTLRPRIVVFKYTRFSSQLASSPEGDSFMRRYGLKAFSRLSLRLLLGYDLPPRIAVLASISQSRVQEVADG